MASIETIMKKVKTFLADNFSAEETNALKEYVKFNETTATVATPAPVSLAKEYKTSAGKTITVEGELTAGSLVKEVTPEGSVDVTDGELTLDDGTKLSVKGGKIESVTPKMEAAQTTPAPTAQLEAQLSEHKTKAEAFQVQLSEQTKEIADLKKQVVLLTGHLVKILETPINTIEEKTEVTQSEYQKFKQNK